MYFQEAGAASGTGLVQQRVQIVASHELTLFVRHLHFHLNISNVFDPWIQGLGRTTENRDLRPIAPQV